MKLDIIECNSYERILDSLKPGNPLNELYNRLIFRGQAIDWKLIPSVFREKQQKNLYDAFYSSFAYDYFQDESMHRFVEHFYLAKFFKYANNIGLKLPKVSFKNVFYSDLLTSKNLKELAACEWITDDLVELAALAQHYGAPTRLLDWSFDIYVALYFASSDAVKMIVNSELENYKNVDTKYLIIWAMSHDILESNIDLNPNNAPPIRFVIPNYSNNPNICAQKGILSYWKSPKIKIQNNLFIDDKICCEPLDVLLSNFKYEFEPTKGISALIKYKIPISESLTILKHVSSLGYNAATMFPGYYGVKQKIDEDIMIKQAEPIFKKEFAKKYSVHTAAHDTTNNSGLSTEKMSKSDIDQIKKAPKQEY